MFVCKTENSHTGKDKQRKKDEGLQSELSPRDREEVQCMLLQHEAHERPDSDITQEAIRKLSI